VLFVAGDVLVDGGRADADEFSILDGGQVAAAHHFVDE
jgi:hypothetical protein